MKRKITKIVLPVGGLGTRFLPATKSLPKEMLPVFNKPIIQYAFEEAKLAGIEDFIFITGRNKNAINNHFDHAYELQSVLSQKDKQDLLDNTQGFLPEAGRIAFIRQQQPLGLGHAVLCAQRFISQDEAFAVILADEMLLQEPRGFLAEMVKIYEEQNESHINLLGTYDVPQAETKNYGIVELEQGNIIKSMVEKPEPHKAPSNKALIGRYILQPEIFSVLTQIKPGSGNEIQLTDAINQLIKEEKQKAIAVDFKGTRFDCGSPIGWLKANIAHAYDNLGSEQVNKILRDFLKENDS